MSVPGERALRVGTLADRNMLTGPLERRRALLGRVRAAGLDHVFVADHISFFTGFGMDGLIQAAIVAALEPELMIEIGGGDPRRPHRRMPRSAAKALDRRIR